MSAEANALGMFSDDFNNIIRPVPIHTTPHKYAETIITDLTDFKQECPSYNNLYNKIHQTHSYKQKLHEYELLLPKFKEWSGYDKFTFHNLEHFFDSLQCALAHNLKMPEWFDLKTFETRAVYLWVTSP